MPAEAPMGRCRGVYPLQQLPLHRGVVFIRVRLIYRAQQRMLCKLRDLIKNCRRYLRRVSPAGRGSPPASFTGLDDEVPDALRAVRRLEHFEAAHVLAAEALGGNGELYFVPRYKVNGYERGGLFSVFTRRSGSATTLLRR